MNAIFSERLFSIFSHFPKLVRQIKDVYKRQVKYLTSAITDENGKAFEKGSKLLVYYAEQGENLWDIAKSHRALLSDIRSQNELYDETVPQSGPKIGRAHV